MPTVLCYVLCLMFVSGFDTHRLRTCRILSLLARRRIGSMENDENIFTVLVNCPKPECTTRATQTVHFNRTELREQLEAGKDVRVLGPICGHEWLLSPQEKENTRKALAAERL